MTLVYLVWKAEGSKGAGRGLVDLYNITNLNELLYAWAWGDAFY